MEQTGSCSARGERGRLRLLLTASIKFQLWYSLLVLKLSSRGAWLYQIRVKVSLCTTSSEVFRNPESCFSIGSVLFSSSHTVQETQTTKWRRGKKTLNEWKSGHISCLFGSVHVVLVFSTGNVCFSGGLKVSFFISGVLNVCVPAECLNNETGSHNSGTESFFSWTSNIVNFTRSSAWGVVLTQQVV